jgi:hypothetical protein
MSVARNVDPVEAKWMVAPYYPYKVYRLNNTKIEESKVYELKVEAVYESLTLAYEHYLENLRCNISYVTQLEVEAKRDKVFKRMKKMKKKYPEVFL